MLLNALNRANMAAVAQLVRALDCDSGGRGFEPRQSPIFKNIDMSYLFAIILGLVQGICEFFPVSSSAHLEMVRAIFIHDNSDYLLFDLVCHLGTTLAAIIILRKEIIEIIFHKQKRAFFLFVAILPLFPMYFLIHPYIKWIDNLSFTGFFLIVTAVFLYICTKSTTRSLPPRTYTKIKDVLFIGSMQAAALFPGISRSGSTISAACIRGWNIKEAICFSFLLAIPTTMGGNFIEIAKAIKTNTLSSLYNLPLMYYVIGGCTAFISGLVAAKFIFSLVEKKKIKPFIWYCLIIGIAAAIYFNMFYKTS
jgi:undecaprenyl-diphosphatase